jgi:RNA polymerase sigma factor (sigma-70 family)
MSQSSLDLSQESDEDLLVYMTMRDDDPSAANQAWEVFYLRHADYLYERCCRLAHGILADSGPADLVQETFIRAYEKAAKFNAGGVTDPGRLRLRVRAWLGKIAQNIFRDMLRGRKRESELSVDGQDLESLPEQQPSPAPLTSNSKLLDEAIDSLSEKKQHILRVTFQYNQPGRKHQRLPNHVAEDLARTYKTTSDNIRQLRRRALLEVDQYIKSRTGVKNS